MKQVEKTKQTYDKILHAAIIEFGNKNYESASLNVVCSKNNISKGLIYHNFKNKEELYLCCAKECFSKLSAYLKHGDYSEDNAFSNLTTLFELRQEFFHKNPSYKKMFFQVIFMPPKNLLTQIKNIKKEFDNFHVEIFKKLLNHINLRDNIDESMAIEYFLFYQEMFNRYFQNKALGDEEFLQLIEDHESRLLNMLNIMLYGIAKQNTEPYIKINKTKKIGEIYE